jgi:hypothetical protein
MRTYAYTIQPMTKPVHLRLSDLRGFHRLASEATVGLTDLVEAMHHTIARAPGVVGESPKGRTSGITGLVYKSVRGVTRLVGASTHKAKFDLEGVEITPKENAAIKNAKFVLQAVANNKLRHEVLQEFMLVSGTPGSRSLRPLSLAVGRSHVSSTRQEL